MAGAQQRKKTTTRVEQDVGTSTSNAIHTSNKTDAITPLPNGSHQKPTTMEEDEQGSDLSEEGESESDSESDMDDIPDQEKWRLINESGIMQQIHQHDHQEQSLLDSDEDDEDDSNRDYLFEGIFFSIPTTCLFIVMDILVHRQYGESYSGANIFRKIVKTFPAILLMVYFSNKAKRHRAVQAAMFAVSVACGCYFLHTMYRSPAMGIMQRAPGIVTILVYCMVQMDLLPAALSLIACGLYFQFGNVKY